MFFMKVLLIQQKKAPGRAAPHRISEWGCSIKWFLPESKCPDIQIPRYADIQISADLFQSVERVGLSANPSSLPSQASQARPGRPASQASRASKPQASRHRCQQFFFIGAPARLLRVQQGPTGSHRADSPLSLRRPLQSIECVRISMI